MVRWLVGLFFISHGAIHWGLWFSTARRDAPFDPNRSWLLSALTVGKTGQQFAGIDLVSGTPHGSGGRPFLEVSRRRLPPDL